MLTGETVPVQVSTPDSSPISVLASLKDGSATEQRVRLTFPTGFVFCIKFKVNNLPNINQHVTGTGPGFLKLEANSRWAAKTVLSDEN